MKSEHPSDLALQIARLLDSDPIASAQVKEHISPERLADLLELSPLKTSTVREAIDNCDMDEEDFGAYIFSHVTNKDFLYQLCCRGIPKSEVLEALA